MRRSDWERLVAELERGDETQVEFAERHGVALSTLRYWLYKLRDEREGSTARSVELLPVRLTSPAGRHFEAQVAGIRLRFEVGTEPAYVAAVVNHLAEPC